MTVEIQIDKSFGPYRLGQIIKVPSTESRVPLDQYWRSRLKDADIDGSCHIRESPSGTKKLGTTKPPLREKDSPREKPSGKKSTVNLTTSKPTK